MPFTINDLLDDVRASRKYFLKHLVGVTNEQIDWKPYPECKSIREVVIHLISGERAAQKSLETGAFPDYDTIQALVADESIGQSLTQLLVILAATEDNTHLQMKNAYANSPLDEEVNFWGSKSKLGSVIGHFSSEDYYHSGQIAFIRMATDPTWDYYEAIYFSA